MTPTHTRHRWGDPIRFEHKTERCCIHPDCSIVKVTQHPPVGFPWIEYWDGLERVGLKAPPCKSESEMVTA